MTADDRMRRRHLSHDEHELWRGVTRSVAPLKRRRVQTPKSMQAAPTGLRSEPNPKIAAAGVSEKKPKTIAKTDFKAISPPASAPRVNAVRVKPSGPKPQPQLSRLDRRTKQRIARGIESIDARIDLHGRTQADAHGVLLHFLRNAQANGARTVLVITGKGSGDATRERGVLRRQVPLWLGLPEFRSLVLGIEDAHMGHGGDGALYVRLRRAR